MFLLANIGVGHCVWHCAILMISTITPLGFGDCTHLLTHFMLLYEVYRCVLLGLREAVPVSCVVGDVIHIKAGEKHWHGAVADAAFSHITLTATGSQTQQTEP